MRSPKLILPLTVALLALGCTVEPSGDLSVQESAICCGANCCSIGGQCFQRGEMNPANSCEQCNPGSSQSAWSAVPDCGADAGNAAPPADAGSTGAPDAADISAPDAGTEPEPTDEGGCRAVTPALSHPLTWAGFVLMLSGVWLRRRRS